MSSACDTWIAFEGSNGKIYFRYCPERDVIQVKPKNAVAQEWRIEEIRKAVQKPFPK